MRRCATSNTRLRVYEQGHPTGITDQRDNHRTGNLTAPIVSAFRSNTETLFADGFESGDTSAWSASTP